jgi:predicted RNA-binding protein
MIKNFWLTITNMENWKIIKDKSIYAFNEKNKKSFDELKIGDYIVMYVTPKKIGGLFKIVSKSIKEKVKFNGDNYLHQIKLKKLLIPKQEIDVNEKIVQNISIFKNSLRWGTILFGRSIKKITKEDFVYIKSLMKEIKC